MRIKLTISYNGTHFLGSQVQKSTPNTINGTLEHVLSKINIDSKVVASGRTDAGVHATAQVCHIDIPPFWEDLTKLKKVLNEMLPHAIHIKSIKKVDDEFHARFSAKKRVYRYLISTKELTPFNAEFVSYYPHANIQNIKQNIKLYLGMWDFRYFMKTGSEVSSTSREIYKAFAYEYKDFIILNFEANGFLYSQIRMMVGALLELDESQIKEQLTLKKKHKFKPAKPNGLYLARIRY